MHNHSDREQNIKIAVFLNISFTIIEVIGGLLTNSLAILSDALHDFGDSIALITSYFAERKAKTPPDKKRTFGYQRLSLFSAFFVAVVLIGGSLFILTRVIPRLFSPEEVNAPGMIGIAIFGVIFNAIGFFRLKKGMSMNERMISWHLLEDMLGWIVIFFGSIFILIWDNHTIDPIMTLGFSLLILWGVFKNLREILNIFLQGVPQHISYEAVIKDLTAVEGVIKCHDVHIWSLEGETDIFTGHVVIKSLPPEESDRIRKHVKEALKKHHIEHSTIEIEIDEFCSCVDNEEL